MPVSCGSAASPEFMRYKAAGITYGPVMGEKERNTAEQYALAEEAAVNGARLIVLTEAATTGYCWYDRAELRPFVEPVPGPTTEHFGRLARQYRCWIVLGLPEVDPVTDIFYNAAVLIGPDGIVGVHRKTHHFLGDPKWARQGNLDHQVYPTPIGNIGMLICMDSLFVETARILGLRGADVIALPSNWLGERTPSPFWLTRAFDNGCYVLVSERVGQERSIRFSGGTVLVNPDGATDCQLEEGSRIVYGEIDLSKARGKSFAHGGNKFLERRPGSYLELMHHTYLWDPLRFFKLYGNDPLPAGKTSRVSVAQVCPYCGDIAANLAQIGKWAAQAAAEDSELIVFPELMLTGLPRDPDQAGSLAESASGPSVDRLIDAAMKHNIHMIVGMVERDHDKLYNMAALISPKGLIGKYRKMHLSEHDRGWASPGDLGFGHFNIPVGRIGILIGHDAMFPEPGRVLALRGVDLICCPSAVNAPRPHGLASPPDRHNPAHWHLWRTRGGENCCCLAFANLVGAWPGGEPFFGRSGIFQANVFVANKEEVTLSETEEELGTCTMDTSDPASMVRHKDFIGMRLPHWYDAIIADRQPGTSW